MRQECVWFDARKDTDQKLIDFVIQRNFKCLVLSVNNLNNRRFPKSTQIIVEIESESQLTKLDKSYIILSESVHVLDSAINHGYKTAIVKKISDEKTMNDAWKTGERYDFLIADFLHETNIPLELLLARFQKKNTKIIKVVDNISDIQVIESVMETGSDGFMIHSDNYNLLDAVNLILEKKENGVSELHKAIVTEVTPMGKGYRACIDTTTILGQNEGFVVGSTSAGGLLVSSETHYLPYMNTRPFRVNAGAIHSYVWTPNQMTSYISELKAGSNVLCFDNKGNTRDVYVGRVKIEIRPLLKIEAKMGDITVNTIVQNDWHIRMMKYGGGVINVSDIVKGTELIGYIGLNARHVGIPIEEHIMEL